MAPWLQCWTVGSLSLLQASSRCAIIDLAADLHKVVHALRCVPQIRIVGIVNTAFHFVGRSRATSNRKMRCASAMRTAVRWGGHS